MTIVTIDSYIISRSGVASRTYVALASSGERGLTLAEICEIAHLKPESIKHHALPKLFHAQICEEFKKEHKTRYRLKRDISVLKEPRGGTR